MVIFEVFLNTFGGVDIPRSLKRESQDKGSYSWDEELWLFKYLYIFEDHTHFSINSDLETIYMKIT